MNQIKANHILDSGLYIAPELYSFTQEEALTYTNLTSTEFFSGMAKILAEFSPENTALLGQRDDLQQKIDTWFKQHKGTGFDSVKYKKFLTEINYLEKQPEDFMIETIGVDTEISDMAGPQLVVPILNARFAINAANARWGSLYDALYGTDAISTDDGAEISTNGYNPVRGRKVIAAAKQFLDDTVPLQQGSHAEVTGYRISQGHLEAQIATGYQTLAYPEAFIAYQGTEAKPSSLLFIHHGLHIDVQIDPESAIGKTDSAGVKDVILESAITTIMDFEDSVAAVDAADKTLGYRNWLGLNTGSLTAKITRNGKTSLRTLNPDREYISVKNGKALVLPGRSLLFVRNVGLHMLSDAIMDSAGNPIYEGILDAIYTVLCALPGLSGQGLRNSRAGSIYIVKPKMHCPAEVALTVKIFSAVEDLFELPVNTIKIGIMDEERRMTLNLKAAIKAAKERVVFINTGFLDRTGDEIHSSMLAGVFVPKDDLKKEPWYGAYETSNVHIGLKAGLSHKAQIGKGMWAMPDLMADLLQSKIQQPMAGATTAWVPSPTAATLHATHYHKVDVFGRHKELYDSQSSDIDAILQLPMVTEPHWDRERIQTEVDSNTQSILGYVTRWIEQGIGCSKVPDIHNIGLMEDRATLRISSQILANWLYHGVITQKDAIESLEKMALVVDQQNSHDPFYIAMAPNFTDSIAFQAAKDLILEGTEQPNGYTEPILHKYRKEFKSHHKN